MRWSIELKLTIKVRQQWYLGKVKPVPAVSNLASSRRRILPSQRFTGSVEAPSATLGQIHWFSFIHQGPPLSTGLLRSPIRSQRSVAAILSRAITHADLLLPHL